jgi:two-component system sensor histidine kinase RpfC
VVGDGEQALDALENERFDLVIMDLNMPELGGLDAARAYRFIDPESVRVPIIILSADVTAEAMEECEEAGIDAFLPKPVEARRLLDTIARLIAERSSALAELSGDGNAAPMVVNPAVLAELELISTGVTFMPDLINGFVKDGEALLRQMEAAVAEGQHDILRDLVHAMKGSAVTLGVEQLSRACGAIVNQPPTEQEAGGQRALRLVREQFQQARVALLEYLKKSQSAVR